MPSIITDEMVREMCKMSRPIPVQAIGVLDPNRTVDAKPNFIRKRGRTGIKPIDLPIYAPANLNGLVKSISNISKIEPVAVENYLDNAINQELGVYPSVLRFMRNEQDISVPVFEGDVEPTYTDYKEYFGGEYEVAVEEEKREEKGEEIEMGGGGGGEIAEQKPQKIRLKVRKPRSDIGIPRGKQKRTVAKELKAAEELKGAEELKAAEDPNPEL
jgi:hypothetical protein